jgi:hypothetical protein
MKPVRKWISGNWEVVVLLVALAFIYMPWAADALPILDFAEFLPLLRAHDSVFGQFSAITHYMQSQGRFCPLQYAYVVAAWNAFGMNASGWHWSYFALNAAVIVTGRALFVKLGVRRPAAIAAIAVWSVAAAVAPAWLRPTGEPIGLLLVIAALGTAYNYHDASDWKSKAFIIAVLAFGTIAAKEMLVTLLPSVWLMTRLRHDNGKWSWAEWSRRDLIVTLAAAIAIVIALAPVAYVALSAPTGNYAGRYGTIHAGWDAFTKRFETMLLPSRAEIPAIEKLVNDPMWQAWLAFPNLVWLALLLVGVIAVVVRRVTTVSQGVRWPLLVAFTLATPGVIAYMPWPSQAKFYMLPFAFGAAMAAAFLIDNLARKRDGAMLAVMAVLTVLITSSFEARDVVNENALRVRTDRALLATIARYGRDLPILAAVPSPTKDGTYGWGLKLAEYGKAAGIVMPSRGGDLSCAEARRRITYGEPAILVSAMEGCGSFQGIEAVVSETVPWRRWPWIFEPRKHNRTAFVLRTDEQTVSSASK